MGNGSSRGEGTPLIKDPPKPSEAPDVLRGVELDKDALPPPVDIYKLENAGYLMQVTLTLTQP